MGIRIVATGRAQSNPRANLRARLRAMTPASGLDNTATGRESATLR